MESILHAIYEAGFAEAVMAAIIVGPVILLALFARNGQVMRRTSSHKRSKDSVGHHVATRNRSGRKVPISSVR